MTEPLRVCTNCSIPHAENCGTCFGWGLKANGVPVTADEAHGGGLKGWRQCPECGGTPHGNIRYLGDMQRLELGPNDICVLRVPRSIRMEEVAAIKAQWNALNVGPTRRLLFLAGDVQFGVLSLSGGEDAKG